VKRSIAWALVSYLVVAALGAAVAWFAAPRRTVTVRVPPSRSFVDSVAVSAVEIYRGGIVVSFRDRGDYQVHVDSLVKANRRIVQVAIHDTLRAVQVDTVVVVDCPCVPEVPGVEFRARFSHAVTYPPGDTSHVWVSLAYVQRDWPLHPNGYFRDFSVQFPELTISENVPDRGWLSRWSGRAFWFSLGAGVGYAADRASR